MSDVLAALKVFPIRSPEERMTIAAAVAEIEKLRLRLEQTESVKRAWQHETDLAKIKIDELSSQLEEEKHLASSWFDECGRQAVKAMELSMQLGRAREMVCEASARYIELEKQLATAKKALTDEKGAIYTVTGHEVTREALAALTDEMGK